MEIKPVIWKENKGQYASGESAYVGSIRIGGFHWNAVDKNGKYKVSTTMPQVILKNDRAETIEEAREIIERAFRIFVLNISI